MIASNKRLILVLLIFAISLQPVPARPTLPAGNNGAVSLSLNQAVEHAITYNAEIQGARADVDIAISQIREIMATGLPQVNASVGYQYYFEIPTSLVPAEFFGGQPGEFAEIQFGTEQSLNASATISQMIFDGSYIVGLRAARIYRELAEQNTERSEMEVRNSVSETYFVALLSRDNKNIVALNIENLRQRLAETEKTSEAGFTDPINADQLRLSVSNMENTLKNLERQHELTLNLLKFQSGIDIDRNIELSDSLGPLFNRMIIESDAGEFSNEDHIDYRIMLSRKNMNIMNLRREQSFYLPSLSLTYTYQQMAMRNEFNFHDSDRPWFPSSFLAVNLSIPVFSSGFRSARVQQARIEVDKSEIAARQLSESLRLQTEEARLQLNAALDQYRSERENLDLAERILERTVIMHREGMASSLELTQANDQMLTTRANYYNAMFEFVTAKNNLDKARGL
ncbi:MAG: TolC family protein [Marinilabiliales bacterium]|nr:MAG: TolC family protein [Marinilabiliales bacterium]